MHTIEEYQEIINQRIYELEIVKAPHELYDPIKYTIELGGKRLRPTLCLLAAEMFGAKLDEALSSAIAIEIFHNFTLIHDDIMDKAPIRRGKMSVYRKWNENIAILSGDAMMAMAYQYLLKNDPAKLHPIIETFNKFAIEVCEGQQFDMNFETEKDLSLDDYINMIRLKTSVLIAGSLKIGAIIGGAKEEDIQNLYAFGENIGIAFQLKDDYLDVFSNEQKFGKQTGGDILTNKKTFLFLKAYELADAASKKELDTCFDPNGNMEPGTKIERVKAVYRKLKVQDETGKEMRKYYELAMSFLDKILLPPAQKSEITKLADNLMIRDV